MATEPPHHFDADEFREAGRAAVDWLADYLEHLGRRPVTSGLEPGDVRSLLPDRAPEAPEPFVREYHGRVHRRHRLSPVDTEGGGGGRTAT